MGFEPMASVLALQCSTSWAMKTHTLGAGVSSSVPVKGMKHEDDVSCGNTNLNEDMIIAVVIGTRQIGLLPMYGCS